MTRDDVETFVAVGIAACIVLFAAISLRVFW